MDRRMLQEHLAEAERHIKQAQAIIARQSAVVEALLLDGSDAAEAEGLLAEFQKVLGIHTQHRDRLMAELDRTKE